MTSLKEIAAAPQDAVNSDVSISSIFLEAISRDAAVSDVAAKDATISDAAVIDAAVSDATPPVKNANAEASTVEVDAAASSDGTLARVVCQRGPSSIHTVEAKSSKSQNSQRGSAVSTSPSAMVSAASVCRLCLLNEEESEEKLIRLRCLCKGSVRFVHKSCAKRWIQVRNRAECEMCGGQMISESKVERFRRRIGARFRNACANASFKETVLICSLLAFLCWLVCYCVYLFTKGIADGILALSKRAQARENAMLSSRGNHTL